MTKRDEQVTEIRNAIERMQSLAEAENLEALETLAEETEKEISALKGVGSVALKTELREEARKASKALREPKKEVHTPGPVEPTYARLDGVSELVTLGADLATEGFRAHRKASELAAELAEHTFNIVLKVDNGEGVPDIGMVRQETRDAMSDMFRSVAEVIGAERGAGEDDDAAWVAFERDLKALQRSVQYHRTSVRGAFLSSVDSDPDRAALFSRVLADKPDGVPASEHLASYYSVSLLGEREMEAARRKAKRLGKDAATQPRAIETKTPAERIDMTIKALPKAILATPADMELVKADPERRQQVAALIDAQVDRLRALRIQLDTE
ncbi:hypothetical protein [Streptomyces albidoflavus]|uniref:hypothetical protein n=1 Tax=Streptomyces albidoflavus TaxID=1886 RepID=UPI0004C95EB4|nr:hypothetical protein [Streptomyces albidoflavus]